VLARFYLRRLWLGLSFAYLLFAMQLDLPTWKRCEQEISPISFTSSL
jgi:hypothetical protein